MKKSTKVDSIKLKKEQEKLSSQIITQDEFSVDEIKLIAGTCQSYLNDNTLIATIAVVRAHDFALVECSHFKATVNFPYIPGFLSYRESPALVSAFSLLENRPDIILVQGNGIIHPRKIGIASHLGLLLDIPTIGVAKKLLIGEINDDKIVIEDKTFGYCIKSREVSNPVYVSPGHRISLTTTKKIIEQCCRGHKLPEPMHIAHKKAIEYEKQK